MKILLIDGENTCWRLMKVLPGLTANGQPVQVLYGVLRLIRSLLIQFEPNAVLVCWDYGRSKFRQKLYPEYKATRDHESTPELKQEFKSLTKQKVLIQAVLRMLNIPSAGYPHTEADDLLGLAANTLPGEKIIVTSDQDVLQLVGPEVSVWSPIKSQLYTNENFRSLTNLSPQQWLEYRALVGDKSDNIDGAAKGFGETTAKELLLRYQNIKTLFSPSVEKSVSRKGNRYALLYEEGARERVYRNLTLMDLGIVAEQPEGKELTTLLRHRLSSRTAIDISEVREFFRKNEFTSLRTQFATWILPFQNLDHV